MQDVDSGGGVGGGPRLTRRGFLHASAATTGALIGWGAAGSRAEAKDYAPLVGDERPEVLSTKEFGILTTVAGRMIVPASAGPSVREARTARRIDRELLYSDGRLTRDIRASLVLMEHGPLLDFTIGRFTQLSSAKQDAFLDACARSRWTLRRNAYSGLRVLCMFFYYTDERTWEAIGYDGPGVPRKLAEAGNAIEQLDVPPGAFRA